tara:strand:+ start:7477 stop:10920 length:3444 start_codon:yes stop_codon:yes gene_type:complete
MANYIPNIEFTIIDSTDASVQGYLDIENATDFPLALTYSVKDVQDPASSKGSFSKTFNLPATKNNNDILKSLYSDSLYNSFQFIEDKDVRIFIDGMLVLQGKFQVQGTKYKGKAIGYECVVFGDNYKWVNALSELNMCDINFDAANIFPDAPSVAVFSRDAIMDTWEFNLAGETIDSTQTHIVYPLVNLGKWTFGDFVAPADMVPAFYLYNIIKVIFGEQGYTVESEFFETDWFKRLVSLIPKKEFINTEDVIEQYSWEYELNSMTQWKEPLDYANQSGTSGDCSAAGNLSFTGCVENMTMVCPACDPNNVITTQTHSNVIFDIETPMNLAGVESNEPETVAGWWWGRYGYDPYGQAYRATYLYPNQCGNNPANQFLGMDYRCILCMDDSNSIDGTYSRDLDADTFQTSFLGNYSFNGQFTVEMDKDYAINNPVEPYCPSPSGNGTFNGGEDSMCYGTLTFQADVETEMYGTTYVANAYLVHYKNDTGRYHMIPVANDRRINEDYNSPPNQAGWFCNLDPLTTDLTFNLNFTDVQLEILSANDKVFVYIEVTAEHHYFNEINNWAASNTVTALCQMKYRIRSGQFSGGVTGQLVEGGSIPLAELLPCDITQMDWINGLTGMFNLMWQSNELEKKIIVEPRDLFLKDATYARNWTDKLDKGQMENTEYIYDALQRNLCFTYEFDSADVFVEERNRRRGQKCQLGSHLMDLGELYENEDQQIGSDFYSPTYMFYDKTISNNGAPYRQPYIPVIHSEYTNIWYQTDPYLLPDKMEEFAPRLLVWYGKQPLNQSDGFTNDNHWFWGYDDNDGEVEKLNYYPMAAVYCDQDGDLGGTLTIGGITYNNPSLYFNTSLINSVDVMPATGYENTNGLYEMFWQRNILSIMDRPKIKRAFFKLTAADIAELDFRRLIFIGDSQHADTYWILNKVMDYRGGRNQLTEVELFEYHNATPDLLLFPQTKKGFGEDITDISTDYNAIRVSRNQFTGSMGNQLGLRPNSFRPKPIMGVQNNNLSFKIQKSFSPTYTSDGTRVPLNSSLKNSSNIGNNNSLNVGSISIGDNQDIRKPNQIIIGTGNNRFSNRPIELTANQKTAACVSSDGIFREGGGGCVYYQDASGKIVEVITGVPKYDLATKTYTHYYTHVVKGNEDIQR